MKKIIGKNTYGETSEKHFDSNDNLIFSRDFDGECTWFKYDDNNNLISLHDTSGYKEFYEYDDKGREISYKDSFGNIITKEYVYENDILVRTTRHTGCSGYHYSKTGSSIVIDKFDKNGQLIYTHVPDPDTDMQSKFKYNKNGKLIYDISKVGSMKHIKINIFNSIIAFEIYGMKIKLCYLEKYNNYDECVYIKDFSNKSTTRIVYVDYDNGVITENKNHTVNVVMKFHKMKTKRGISEKITSTIREYDDKGREIMRGKYSDEDLLYAEYTYYIEK